MMKLNADGGGCDYDDDDDDMKTMKMMMMKIDRRKAVNFGF